MFNFGDKLRVKSNHPFHANTNVIFDFYGGPDNRVCVCKLDNNLDNEDGDHAPDWYICVTDSDLEKREDNPPSPSRNSSDLRTIVEKLAQDVEDCRNILLKLWRH